MKNWTLGEKNMTTKDLLILHTRQNTLVKYKKTVRFSLNDIRPLTHRPGVI